jgi:hypothetical protein
VFTRGYELEDVPLNSVESGLHTLLHTENNRAVGRINAGFFLIVCSHNPLVGGSSPSRPTIYKAQLSKVGLFFEGANFLSDEVQADVCIFLDKGCEICGNVT